MFILVKCRVHLNHKYRSAHTKKSNLLIFSSQKRHWKRAHSLQLKCSRSIKIVLQMTSCQVNDNVKSVNINSHDSCCRDPVIIFSNITTIWRICCLLSCFPQNILIAYISYSYNWRLVYIFTVLEWKMSILLTDSFWMKLNVTQKYYAIFWHHNLKRHIFPQTIF